MNQGIQRKARRQLKRRTRRKIWKKIVTVLGCVVVFCTTYALILPAITLSGKAYCGIEEHKHNEECYTYDLICAEEAKEDSIQKHEHAEGCYEINQNQICELEESEEHQHAETCFEVITNLICTEPEETIIEGHQHTEGCYKEILKCKKELHTHKKACFSNPDKDIESKEDWEKTLPDELTGDWRQDVLLIAESQLGYEESTKNYIIDENGKKKGYTRYGAWYGDHYGHWCAMFVSFCIDYAGVEGIPLDSNCQHWIETLSKEEYQLYHKSGEYIPEPGDLIFFDWNESPEKENRRSEHIGLVVEVIEETEDEPAKVKTIEGNASDMVKYKTYELDATTILGYGQLPENPENQEEEEIQEIPVEEPAVFAMARVSDPYAPEGVTLTGNWGKDVAAIADSHIGYTETEGISLFDQWAGGDGYGSWDLDFIKYCLHYAGVSEDAVPWGNTVQEIYSLAKENGALKFQVDNKPEPGDLVFVGTWRNDFEAEGYVQTIGICQSLESNGRLMIVKGDRDGGVGVQEYWNHNYDVYGVIKLSKSIETTVPGVLTAKVSGNLGVLGDSELVVSLEDSSESAKEWRESVNEELVSSGKTVLSDHFVTVDLENATEDMIIDIEFDTPLSCVSPGGEKPENVKWVQYIIDDNNRLTEPAKKAQIYTDADENLTGVSLSYENAKAYVFIAVESSPLDMENVSVATLDELVSAVTDESVPDRRITLTSDMDATELENVINITSDKNIILDLNGKTITADSRVFDVKGGKLTLTDSQENVTEEEKVIGDVELTADESYDSQDLSDMVGRLAQYDSQKKELVYYVTTTQVADSNRGATKETMIERTAVLSGVMDGTLSSEPLIRVSSGKFTMDGGAMTGCNNSAIDQRGGSIYLNGGYLCGNKTSGSGAAVYSEGSGNLVINGAVLAANEAGTDGGAIFINGKSLAIQEGVISGNVCKESGNGSGGGIYGTGFTIITMSGGYITNNRCDAADYNAGGGGIYSSDNAIIHLYGGYVTGNYAGGGGGGIRTAAAKMYMTEGYVNSNYADTAEGGGIAIHQPCDANITGGYINNNVTNTYEHWGGGGIFCANDSTLQLLCTLITANHAGGYGGGVAGCSTGRTYINKDEGCAIYENSAGDPESAHLSGGSSTKNEDHLYTSELFHQEGYEDYFSAFNSVIEGTMLGGEASNWTGSTDGLAVRAEKEDTLSASYVMGLVSNPTDVGKQAAEEAAKVYINGNESFVHGGGVLCNGYLFIGNVKTVEVFSRLQIDASKALLGEDGSGQQLIKDQFQFEIKSVDTGMIVATGTNEADGKIPFDRMIPLREEGIYTYHVYEVPNENTKGLIMDSTIYEIVVQVSREKKEDLLDGIEKYNYEVTHLKVDKIFGDTRTTIQDLDPEDKDQHAVDIQLSDDAAFKNVKCDITNIKVAKKWSDTEEADQTPVYIQLKQNGQAYGDVVNLSEENDWQYTWEEIPLREIIDGEIFKYEYSVEEVNAPSGFEVTYDTKAHSDSKTVWAPLEDEPLKEGGKYILVSADEKYIFRPYAADKVESHWHMEIDGEIQEDELPAESIFTGAKADVTAGEKIVLKNITRDWAIPTISTQYDGAQGLKLRWDNLSDLYAGDTQISYHSENGLTGEDWEMICENGAFWYTEKSNVTPENAVKIYTQKTTAVSSEIVFTVTNKKIDVENIRYSVDLTKVSKYNSNLYLEGATFQVLAEGEDGETVPLTFKRITAGSYEYCEPDEEGALTEVSTAFGGKLILKGLPADEYILRETKAPNGYQTSEDQKITLGDPLEQTVSIVVESDSEERLVFEFPETGGTGTSIYTISGVLMLAISALLFIKRKKEKRV